MNNGFNRFDNGYRNNYNNGYSGNNYSQPPQPPQNNYGAPPQNNNYGSSAGKDMDISVGMWVKTILLSAIPFLGVVIYIFWLLGISRYQARINYARGSFVIFLVIAIIFIILLATVFASVLAAFSPKG